MAGLLLQQRGPVEYEGYRAWFGFLNRDIHEKPVTVTEGDILATPRVIAERGRFEEKLRPGGGKCCAGFDANHH